MKDKKKSNPIMDLSKITFNKKISSGVVTNILFVSMEKSCIKIFFHIF